MRRLDPTERGAPGGRAGREITVVIAGVILHCRCDWAVMFN